MSIFQGPNLKTNILYERTGTENRTSLRQTFFFKTNQDLIYEHFFFKLLFVKIISKQDQISNENRDRKH